MTTYSSKPVDVAMPASTVFDRISNLGTFQERIDQLPEDIKAKIGSVTFTEDTIVINAAPMGDICLLYTSRCV